jgi:cobalt-precorrin 5A hydrolase
MERDAMKVVAGFGFQAGTTTEALAEVLAAAGPGKAVTHLATLEPKATGLAGLAQRLGLPVVAVPLAKVRATPTPTQSQRVQALYGTGSIAEAVALAAAGPGARLCGPRVVSADGTATAAIAEGGAL